MKLCLCHWAGCEALTQGYYCSKHKAIADKRREEHQKECFKKMFKDTKRTTSKPYHSLYESSKWKVARKNFLELHPYCVVCGAKAVIADHITPHKGNLELFYDTNNLQAMCWACHSSKTLKENNYFKKKMLDR